MKFLVHGSIAYDLLLGFEGSFAEAIDPKSLNKLSVSFFAPRLKRHHGGTAANIAWNLRLLGGDPLLVGSVGDDGGPYLALLEERGIPVGRVQKFENAVTATAIIGTDNGGRQIAFFHPGADQQGELPDLADDRDDIAFGIISPRDMGFMLKAADQCAKLKIRYLFDPGQQSHRFSQDEFRRAVSDSAGIVVNEYEWELSSKALGWSEKKVIEECGLLVITLAEKGVRLVTAKEDVTVPACPAEVVNPTGAGDALRAGLLMGMGAKWSLRDSGRLGAIMGALVVAQEGTLLDSLDKDVVQAKALETYGEKLPKW